MPQRLLSFFALLFGVSVLAISIWRTHVSSVSVSLALEATDSAVEEQQSEVMEVTSEESDYSLPYPGILPDHPLYFLKMVRDRIQLWLTRNPVNRAELMLHYADKRFAASLALAEDGKSGLAMSTATKASYYADDAVGVVEGMDADEASAFLSTAHAASMKHAAVLDGILSRVPDEAKGSLDEAIQTNLRTRSQVEDLLSFDDEMMEKESEDNVMMEENGSEATEGAMMESDQ